MVRDRVVNVKERVIGEISAFPESKLYEIQEYIYFMKFKEQNRMNWSNPDNDVPLDDFDYELANRHIEKEYHEYKDLTSFDDMLKECGLTRDDL